MLKIETGCWDFGQIIKISNDIDSFEILFGGNGDLCFNPVMNRMELYESNDPICFNISKEDGFLYDSFKKLYNKICEYSPYDYNDSKFSISEVELINDYKRRDSCRDYPLVHDGIISWHSDEECCDTSSILNIYKLDDESLKLEFIKNKPEDEFYMTYGIRFRNSGSTYNPFNLRFMELYNNLCNYYFSKSDENKQKNMILKK